MLLKLCSHHTRAFCRRVSCCHGDHQIGFQTPSLHMLTHPCHCQCQPWVICICLASTVPPHLCPSASRHVKLLLYSNKPGWGRVYNCCLAAFHPCVCVLECFGDVEPVPSASGADVLLLGCLLVFPETGLLSRGRPGRLLVVCLMCCTAGCGTRSHHGCWWLSALNTPNMIHVLCIFQGYQHS